MGNTLKIRDMELGAGIPRICVPITEAEEAAILKEAKNALEAGADLIEWRADYFQHVFDIEKTKAVVKELRKIMGNRPILFTYRTEDGRHSIEPETYIDLNRKMAEEADVDLLDIELFMGDAVCAEFCDYAHKKQKAVIISNHDFEKTPCKEDIIRLLCKMQKLGADVPKVAVMPSCAEDVLTLLSATNEYAENHADGPVITMSMKWLGAISRISGEIFGSALTFGSTARASAPGQLAIADLRYILDVLHCPIEK